MHTAACHMRMPAYRHKTNTAMPISSAAEILTVKAHHLLSPLDCRSPRSGASYPAPKLRRVFRRSHRTRNRHFSHTPAISPATAPHTHTGRPLRHPVNFRPILITSRQRPLAIRKVRSAKNAAPPGYHRFRETPRFLSGSPASFQWVTGLPGFIQLSYSALSGPARAVSSPARAGVFRCRPRLRFMIFPGHSKQPCRRHPGTGNRTIPCSTRRPASTPCRSPHKRQDQRGPADSYPYRKPR